MAQGGDSFTFDDDGRLPLFAQAKDVGQLTALYDLFENMLKAKNKRQLAQLMEGMDESSVDPDDDW